MDNIIKAAQESGHLQIISVSAPQPHLAAQPGLRGHSVSPGDDLLKKWIVYKFVPSGRLGVASFDTYEGADTYVTGKLAESTSLTAYEIEDQFSR